MKYISGELTEEIRQRHGELLNRQKLPQTKMRIRANRIEKALNSSRVHSFRIENPGLRVPYNVPKNRYKREIKEGAKRLEEAFLWGIDNFQPESFNEDFIQQLALYVVPELSRGGVLIPYRETGTQITGSSVTPPDPYKVRSLEMPRFVENIKKYVKTDNVICQMEGAIYAHLHLARIHPFEDGNGRIARTLQDVILNYSRLPAPIVKVGERHNYYELLDKAVYDWKHLKNSGDVSNGATLGEKTFYTFMAGKINESLDKILRD